ncbi:hypothetical protein EVA_14564 [gut metagenome]|uniref:Uncharacterized protein n=1 Tax=gut metagenome TaxID=749906 RepID=J9G6A8_9ZZZZ
MSLLPPLSSAHPSHMRHFQTHIRSCKSAKDLSSDLQSAPSLLHGHRLEPDNLVEMHPAP